MKPIAGRLRALGLLETSFNILDRSMSSGRRGMRSTEPPQIHPPPRREQRRPQVPAPPHARRHVVDAEVVDGEAALDLRPGDRRRDGGARRRAHRVDRSERPAPRVLVVVDQDVPARAPRHAVLRRDELRMVTRQLERDRPGDRPHLLLRRAAHDRDVDHVARGVLDRADGEPVGARRRGALHEERFAARAVRVAPHHHGAVADVGEEGRRDIDVVADEIALGDAEGGPEELAEIGELHPAFAERDEHLVLIARDHPAGAPARRGGWWPARAAAGRGVVVGGGPGHRARGTQSTPPPALASAALLVVAQATHADPRGGDPALRAAPRRVAARRPGRLPRALGRGHDFPIAGARRTAPWPRRLRRPGAPGLRLRAPARLRLHARRGRGRRGARRVAHRGRAARRRAAYRVVGDERRGGAGRPHPALARVLEPGRRGVSFAALFGRSPSVTADAPGRVNLIGEHTDYNQGFVLPTPIPQRTVAELAPRADEQVRAASASLTGEVEQYALGAETPGRGWLDYVQGLTWALRSDGALILGFDLRVASSVPIGAGPAPSRALEGAVLRALAAAFRR